MCSHLTWYHDHRQSPHDGEVCGCMSVAAGHANRDFDVSIPALLVEDMVLKGFSSDFPNAKVSLCNALEDEIRELRRTKTGNGDNGAARAGAF